MKKLRMPWRDDPQNETAEEDAGSEESGYKETEGTAVLPDRETAETEELQNGEVSKTSNVSDRTEEDTPGRNTSCPEGDPEPVQTESEEDSDPDNVHTEPEEDPDTAQTEEDQKAEKKSFWKRMTFFSRFSVILLIISLLMALVFGLLHRIPSLTAAVLQIVGITAALLFHGKKLKSSRKWLNRITILLAVLLLMGCNLFFSIRKIAHSQSIADRNAQHQSSTESQGRMLGMPLSSEECLGKNYSDIYRQLRDAGFTNVDSRAVEDLAYDETAKVGTVTSVLADQDSVFQKGQEYPADCSIEILYHDYQRCSLRLIIDFKGNLLFSKYDIDLYINDRLTGTLEHGTDGEFLFSEKPGTYTLRFEKTGDSDISEEYVLEFTEDTDLGLTVSCDKTGITIEEQYRRNPGAAEEETDQSDTGSETDNKTENKAEKGADEGKADGSKTAAP